MDVHITRGFAYSRIGDNDQAIADFTRAIALGAEKREDVFAGRGGAYNKLKQNDNAISDFNRAIELNSKFPGAYNNRGEANYASCFDMLT